MLNVCSALVVLMTVSAAHAADRPNILWISCEDTSPDLGCYGDSYARTPNLDRLASQGARFTNAYAVAGVCAPSRSGIITGMYPCSIGTHHMRSQGVPPPFVKCFPEYLRAAGYYCTNNVKTDYNFAAPITAWDECSKRAHYRNRAAGQPFFAVFNITTTHESKIRADATEFAKLTARLTTADRHDPLKAVLPPYYPDTPVVRNDWARYYDLVTAMDLQAADLLKELEDAGLADNTVVFFFGDHGRGLPRAKRWLYDSGIRAPLIVRWPGRIKPGTVRNDMVSFIDLGPTLLTIAGVSVPRYMQGRPIPLTAAPQDSSAGPAHSAPSASDAGTSPLAKGGHEGGLTPRRYIFAARDRMDETYDIIRCVRDSRYKLIRNFKPARPYAQYIDYMEKMPTMQELRRLNKEGKLTGPQTIFFLPEKPPEELYDLEQDPHEVRNLIDAPELAAVRERLRNALDSWMREVNDLGLVPEPELKERMRPGGKWATTAPVHINLAPASDAKPSPAKDANSQGAGSLLVSITCPTEGASIAYRLDATGTKGTGWKLYTQPFLAPVGATLRAKACRLGYHDSPEESLTLKLPSAGK